MYQAAPLAEAPHRGYDSAAALFAGVRSGDDVGVVLLDLLREHAADVVLGPQALGAHVDHLVVVRAALGLALPTARWADVPYVLRHPGGPPSPDLLTGLAPLEVAGDDERRTAACRRYTSQLGFQFGGPDGVAPALAGAPERLLTDACASQLLTGC